MYDTTTCEIRGLGYAPGIDNRTHKKYHDNFLQLQSKYGVDFIMAYNQQEKLKREGSRIANNEKLSTEKRVAGVKMAYRSFFGRSALTYGLNHPSFADYVAMLQKASPYFKQGEADEVTTALIKEFGLKDGIKPGSSYYRK